MIGARFKIGNSKSLQIRQKEKWNWKKTFRMKRGLLKIEEELKNYCRKIEKKHKIEEGNNQIRLR